MPDTSPPTWNQSCWARRETPFAGVPTLRTYEELLQARASKVPGMLFGAPRRPGPGRSSRKASQGLLRLRAAGLRARGEGGRQCKRRFSTRATTLPHTCRVDLQHLRTDFPGSAPAPPAPAALSAPNQPFNSILRNSLFHIH